MNCVCSGELPVIETISFDDKVCRKRKCQSCHKIYYTCEEFVTDPSFEQEFKRRNHERVKKYRANKKGVEYVPDYERDTESSSSNTPHLF